ncbi:MAG TPA: M28 family metallopeptidase [Acidobacteriaceae bacterium]|nr:M28 family metallopeptidase [Acidobacteriaceae bacterium]
MFNRSSAKILRLAVPSLFLLPAAAFAQSAAAHGTLSPAPADPAIAAAIERISPQQVHEDIAKLVSFKNRSTLSSLDSDLPPGTGVLAAADWIASEFEHISEGCGHCLEVKRDDFIEPPQQTANPRIVKPTRIVNVYAVLKGADPAQADRRVLVTGHYDSRNSDNFNTHDPAPGANDDASGVAVSLESARVLTTSGIKFPATIVFAVVAGEEQGLNGSGHLAKLAKQEGWDLEAVLNDDIVGGDTTPGDTMQDKTAVRVFSEGVPSLTTPEELRRIQTTGAESDSPSRELARAIADIAATYFPVRRGGFPGSELPRPGGVKAPFHPVLVFRRDRFLRGGDHSSFNTQGFAAVRFTEWRENFNHQHQNVRVAAGTNVDGTQGQVQYGDLLDFVDFNYVSNVARLNAATLATLALAPGEPQNVKVMTTQLDNNTQLTWEPPKGFPADASYEVVWRETTAPLWTNAQSAGTKTSITLPISKDNVVFGVRSVDAAGHRSPAVYPWPARPAPQK